MSEDKLQAISIRLNGKNYSYWSYVMENFIVDKEVSGHVTGTTVPPSDTKKDHYAASLLKWHQENAQILTWFHNSIEPSIGMNFSKFKIDKKVWDYLKEMYLESIFAKQKKLERSTRNAIQTDKSIQEFYNEMMVIWISLPSWNLMIYNPLTAMCSIGKNRGWGSFS